MVVILFFILDFLGIFLFERLIFINDKAFVGPKPYRVYRSAINKYIFF